MHKGDDRNLSDPKPLRQSDNRALLLVVGGLWIFIFGLLCWGAMCISTNRCGGNPEPTSPAPTTMTPKLPVFIEPTIQTPVTITTPPITVTTPPVTITTPPITVTTPAITLTPTEDYFPGFPPEYKTIQLPQQSINVLKNQDGFVIPLPVDRSPLQEALILAANGYPLSRFDLNRVINFSPELDFEAYDYIAVPTSPEFYKEHFADNDFNQGVLAGLLYDRKGAFASIPDLYEIWVFQNYIALSSITVKNAIILEGESEYEWVTQEVSSDLPLAIFIKNGCRFCWRVDRRCGCLVCRSR